MPKISGILQHLDLWHDVAAAFHEDIRHATFEARLRVADNGKPSDDIGAIVTRVVQSQVVTLMHPPSQKPLQRNAP